MSRVIAVVACGFSLAACSTSLPSLSLLKPSSSPETLRIESEPPGADAKTSLGQSCRTPCELAVQSGGEFAVTLALNGYQAQTVMVQPDAAEPARLMPNPIYVELEPATAQPTKKPARKKPRAVAARPAAPATEAAAAPTTTATATASAAPAPTAPPPMPATPAEPAVSATNYPWPSR